MNRIKAVKNYRRYTNDFKRKVAGAYLSGRFSYAVGAELYGLSNGDVVKEFVRWYRRNSEFSPSNVLEDMSKKSTITENGDDSDLHKQIRVLEAELKFEKLKVEALNTMIDIAEEQLHIDIRKKSGSQQLKK
jgi:hypothetical protein